MEQRKRRPEIDFVPEENEWMPDESPQLWEADNREDLERTLVLEPLDDLEAWRDEEAEERFPERSIREKYDRPVKPSYLKYGRDPYENLEKEPEPWPAGPEVWPDKRESRKRTEREGNYGRVEKGGTGKQRKKEKDDRSWRRRPLLFRLVSLAAMGVLLAGLGKSLWAERESLGQVFSALEEKNYAELFYLFLAACTAFYGAFSLLWMLSGKRVYWDGRLRRMDVGRGITPFFLFILLAFVSARTALRLPEEPWFFVGLARYLLAVTSVRNLIYVCGSLGILCCILRKCIK